MSALKAILPISACLLLSGCGNGAPTSASASATTSAAASSAAKSPAPIASTSPWCAKLGGTGPGTLEEMCAVKSAPFDVQVLDRYHDGIEGRMCSIKNTSGEDLNWGGVKGFYYDKDGKLLAIQPTNLPKPLLVFSHSGTDFVIKAGETIEYECGWQRTDEPAGSTLEIEVYQWGRDEPERYFMRDLGGKAWEARPKGGF
ncbi:MAG: hypothetical protein U0414_08895 [Polyangiaceae bacterium]